MARKSLHGRRVKHGGVTKMMTSRWVVFVIVLDVLLTSPRVSLSSRCHQLTSASWKRKTRRRRNGMAEDLLPQLHLPPPHCFMSTLRIRRACWSLPREELPFESGEPLYPPINYFLTISLSFFLSPFFLTVTWWKISRPSFPTRKKMWRWTRRIVWRPSTKLQKSKIVTGTLLKHNSEHHFISFAILHQNYYDCFIHGFN